MIIISGPSTIGKNPLIELICVSYNYQFVIPVTTRDRRKKEKNGVDYYFLDKNGFKEGIISTKIFEWDYCLSNYYGFYLFNLHEDRLITHALSRMAIRLRMREKNVITIFLMPNNLQSIEKTIRKIYTGTELILRLAHLEEEISNSSLFDYIFTITKDSLDLLNDDSFLRILNNNFLTNDYLDHK